MNLRTFIFDDCFFLVMRLGWLNNSYLADEYSSLTIRHGLLCISLKHNRSLSNPIYHTRLSAFFCALVMTVPTTAPLPTVFSLL